MLELQAGALGRTAGETARLRQEESLRSQFARAHIEVDEELAAKIKALSDRAKEAADANQKLQREMAHLQAVGSAISSGLEGIFRDWISGAEVNWDKFFKKLLADLAVLTLRMYILQPLFGGGPGSQGGGLLGSLFGGGKAEGGPVTPGTAYLVGERGPELFLPGAHGTIMPNAMLAGAAGGAGPAIVNMRIDLAGANGEETIARIAKHYAALGAREAIERSNAAFPARQRQLRLLGT